MNNTLIQKIISLRYCLSFLVLVLVFQFNFLKTSSDFQFKTYRDGSEALVLGKIFSDVNGIDTGHSNMGFVEKEFITNGSNVLSVYGRIDHPKSIVPLKFSDLNWSNGFGNYDNAFLVRVAETATLGYSSNELVVGQELVFPDGQSREITKLTQAGGFLNVSYSGSRVSGVGLEEPYIISVIEHRPYAYSAYPKQFGGQAVALSWLYRNIPFFSSVFALQFLIAAAAALVFTLLVREISLSVSAMFAGVFFLSIIGSPWLVAVARNLYWASFLWFLPAVVAMMVYRSEPGTRKRLSLMVLFCFSVFLKCLAGYEYISTIVIFSLCIFLIDPFKSEPRHGFGESMKAAFKLGCLAILGFILANLVHADMRANTIVEGLSQTFGTDAIKYSALTTMSDAVIPRTPLGFILGEYVNEWKTPVLFWFGNESVFRVMLVLSVSSLVIQFCLRDKELKRDIVILVVTALASLSWFVLVQKHSAIHVHLNYVLWYFGFVQAMVFVIVRGCISLAVFSKVVVLCGHKS
ncbi:hypothetical protein KVG95_00175 [Pseudomonas sp. SWRI79]|uniref:Transmembrane protein n=1 Tax=Pseudomonas farris TaxID=2841207 RepID=A0ABS6PMN9_9PSED|nr:hypothetical protein [Pseudomonas farris]MBV4461743.1 hypothetical protein [Pseudomonas farris]